MCGASVPLHDVDRGYAGDYKNGVLRYQISAAHPQDRSPLHEAQLSAVSRCSECTRSNEHRVQQHRLSVQIPDARFRPSNVQHYFAQSRTYHMQSKCRACVDINSQISQLGA